jgi:predicted nucleic acid-binding protein
MKKYINITASLVFWNAYTKNYTLANYKKIRLCNQTDFENVDYLSGFEENATKNFDHCIDDYEGMIVTNNQDYHRKLSVTDGITHALAEVYGIVWYSSPEEVREGFKNRCHVRRVLIELCIFLFFNS